MSGMTYELRLAPTRSAKMSVPLLGELLIALGLPAGALAEHEERGRQRLSVYFRSARDAARWQRRIDAARLDGVGMQLRRLRDADWQDTWKRHVRPFAIAPGLRIVPAWSAQAKRGPDAQRIILETGLAFGTGKHATTRWMAQTIQSLRGRFHDVLDVGLGTGILALIAARCGASRLVGVDIDREAVLVSRRNLQINGVPTGRLVRGDFGRLRGFGRFDLVVANIGATELLAMRRRLIDAVRPGKYLAVTGIGREHVERFRRVFEDRSLRCLKIRANADWAAFLYQARV